MTICAQQREVFYSGPRTWQKSVQREEVMCLYETAAAVPIDFREVKIAGFTRDAPVQFQGARFCFGNELAVTFSRNMNASQQSTLNSLECFVRVVQRNDSLARLQGGFDGGGR